MDADLASPQHSDFRLLEKRSGSGRWRKLKGVANVRLSDDTIRLAELHRFEAHGIGKKKLTINVIWINAMSRHLKPAQNFAACIRGDDQDLLTPRMIYRLIPD